MFKHMKFNNDDDEPNLVIVEEQNNRDDKMKVESNEFVI